jgi:hypothetical protein
MVLTDTMVEAWYIVWICWCLISIAHQISQWGYANTIETAVLVAIVYDIGWHRWNAYREIKRDEEQEKRTIEREDALEKREIRRERNESLRKHWQELQRILISLHRVTSLLMQQKRFLTEHNHSEDATTQRVLSMMADRVPDTLAEFYDLWGQAVAQLNVFPQPRDILALEVLSVVEGLGKTVGDATTEVNEETLRSLADLSRRVTEHGAFTNCDNI